MRKPWQTRIHKKAMKDCPKCNPGGQKVSTSGELPSTKRGKKNTK